MLKGKATIQLINAETNEIEYEKVEENMITNSITNLLNPKFYAPYDLFGRTAERGDWLKAYTPIKNLIGGIMLFNSEITESANNIIPSSDLISSFTGCANIEFAGNSKFRGTLNATESTKIENGYRYVWDFPTNAGNGGINAICLSSKACNLDKDVDDDSNTAIFSDYGFAINNSSNFYNYDITMNNIIPSFNYLYFGDFLGFIEDKLLFIRYTNWGTAGVGYTLTKIKIKNQLGLFENIAYYSNLSDLEAAGLLEKEEVEVKIDNRGEVTGTDSDGNNVYEELGLSSPFFMGMEDNITTSFSTKYNYDEQKLKIYIRRINVLNSNVEYLEKEYVGMDLGSNTNVYCTFANNKIYITNSSNSNCYIVDLESDTYKNINIGKKSYKAIKFLDSVVFCDIANNRQSIYFLKNDDTLAKWDLNIGNSGKDFRFTNFYFNSSLYPYPCFVTSTVNTTSNTRIGCLNLCTFNAFLISINNISPIIKHQSQVLKIIYDITEAS